MSSVITSLYYVSPYSSLPANISAAGITLRTDPAQSPTPAGIKNPVLVMRLRLATGDVIIGISATSGLGTGPTLAVYQPPFPLSATESYMIDVIWVPSGTLPENIDWNTAVTAAPVIAAGVSLVSAGFNGTVLNAQLAYSGNGAKSGAQVSLYSLSGGTYVRIGIAQTETTNVSVTATNLSYPAVYFISVQAAIPVTNPGAAGSFSAPFSLGPPSVINSFSAIPQKALNISAAGYNGKSMTLSWTLNALTASIAPDSSLVQVLSNGTVMASIKGGPQSATIPLDVLGQTGITVQINTILNNISSAALTFSPITAAPVVSNAIIDPGVVGGMVRANVTTVPSGPVVQAWLMDGDKVLAGPSVAVNGLVSFGYDVAGMVGVSIVAAATSADGTISGPKSSPAILLASAPVLQSTVIYIDPSDATQWRIDAAWSRLPDAAENVNSYTVAVLLDNTIVATKTVTGTSATLRFATSAIGNTKTQIIQLYATGITGGRSLVQQSTAIFTAPQLNALVTTASQIMVDWTAPPVIAASALPAVYQPVVMYGGNIVYRGVETEATQGLISLPDLYLPLNKDILVLVNVAIGPVMLQADPRITDRCSAVPILSAPGIAPVSTLVMENISTLNWSAVTGASAYTINFTTGDTVSNVSKTSYPLTGPQKAGSGIGYTILATGSSNGVPVSGPPSALAFVPTNAANVSSVRFDGDICNVSWDAVPDVISYNIFLLDAAANTAYSGTATGTSLSFPFAADPTKEYNVYVQPVMNNGTGLTGATLPLFNTGLFLSRQPASAAYPYMYPAENMAALGTAIANPVPQAITLYLPELGAAPGALGTDPIVVNPFTVEPSGTNNLPYKLTIAADALVWEFNTTGIRASLQSAYINFLKKIELPGNSLPGATPYGISLVQAAIAGMMPQTFAEQLYYNFGFSTVSTVGAGFVDLRPGMILRVLASDYINIAQSGLPSWINGYSGGNVMDMEIGGYNTGTEWLTGFDAFLSTLSAQGLLHVSSPAASVNSVQAGLANPIDLYYTQFVQPFYRLYFPSAISSAWGTGSNATGSNFTLAAAASYSVLQNTTVNPADFSTAYFRGRAIIEVMIKVLVNGNERIVPIGTTVGNLLEQLGVKPIATSPVLKQLRVYRSIAAAITSTDAQTTLGPQMELRVDWKGLTDYSTGYGLNAMSAPLLPGDQIFTNETMLPV